MRKANTDWRVYEYFDPRPGEKRRWVGIGRGKAPWRKLKAREFSKLAKWLKEMASAGVKPKLNWGGLPSTITFKYADAVKIAALRKSILRSQGYQVLTQRFSTYCYTSKKTSRPVTVTARNSRYKKYPSMKAASRAIGKSLTTVQYYIKRGKDPLGNKWRCGQAEWPRKKKDKNNGEETRIQDQ